MELVRKRRAEAARLKKHRADAEAASVQRRGRPRSELEMRLLRDGLKGPAAAPDLRDSS